MSISRESPPASTDIASKALDFLKGCPNPFENLVRPQRPDDRFLDVHVPDLVREPRELAQVVIDAYRLVEYRSVSDLPDSRVVTVLGARGSGKTHLLEAIAHRDDGHRQLLVRPAYFEPEVAFDDYLLGQLVNGLLTNDPVHGGRPFDAIALALTRRLVRQALAELGPVERLLLGAPSGWARWRLLWCGGESLAGQVEQFRDGLAKVKSVVDLASLAKNHELAPQLLIRLVEDYVERWEKGDEALPAIRRQLYPAFARGALLKANDALAQFLEADYAPVGARPFYRTEIVRQLLTALVEACALVRLPVVFVFDNLEGLLAPQGKLDTSRVRGFFDSLAQAVDASRGLLFILSAEAGLYRDIRKEAHAFALTRVDQGVPVSRRGPVDVIELRSPKAEEMDQMIARRVGRLLRGFADAAGLPRNFPFPGSFLTDLAAREGLELRNKLLRLRDEYSRIVYHSQPPAVPPAPPLEPDWNTELTRAWTDGLASATRRMHNRDLVTLNQDLHAGLRQLFQHAGAVQSQGLELAGAQAMNTVDGHGTYSHVTVVDWRVAGTNGQAAPAFRVCVGLLVGRNRGMPRDLKAKFVPLGETTRQPDALVILWPAPAGQQLPTETAQVWEENAKKARAVLHCLSDEELNKLLALPEWVREVRARPDQPVPETVLRDFVRQKCQILLSFVVPPNKG